MDNHKNQQNRDAFNNLFISLGANSGGSIVSRIVEQFRTLILTNQLPEGYSFPNENILCEYLQVGRSTLREAFTILEAFGFVTRTKRGTFVNSSYEIAMKMPFSMTLDLSDQKDLLDFRIILESSIAGVAALRATKENIERLRSCVEEMNANIENVRQVTYSDLQFHVEMAVATQNPLLNNAITSTTQKMAESTYMNFCLNRAIRIRALRYHQNILDAVVARDAETARKSMHDHIWDNQSLAKRLQADSNLDIEELPPHTNKYYY